MTLFKAEDFKTLVGGLDHPEDIVWGRDGKLYAGSESGILYRIDIKTQQVSEFANTKGFVLGLAVDANNTIYACDTGLKAVIRVSSDGVVTKYCPDWNGQPMMNPNYPVFDAQGNLYVSDSGEWWKDNGSIYRIEPGGKSELFSKDSNQFPNGLALSPDGKFLYIAESNLPGVARIPIGVDGTAGKREVVVELPQTVPDGLTFDADGNLYISCYHPNIIYRYSPSGKLETLVDDWSALYLTLPTNIAFGGDQLDILFVANLGGYQIAHCRMPNVKGAPLHYPNLD